MSQTIIPWQMKDADGNLLSPNVWTNTIYDADGNLISGIATEREVCKAYDSSKTYPTYSPYCIHNNKLYKYSGASGTTTTGTWDSTKWTETDVAGELSTINSKLVKYDSVTATTSGSGNISLGLTISQIIPISAYTHGSDVCLIWCYTDNTYRVKVLKSTLEPLANTSVTVYFSYIDLR